MSQEILREDLAAIDAAEQVLSALVTGEKVAATADFGPVYARLTGYFAKYVGSKLFNTEMMKHVARMFITISEAKNISGFQCQEFEALLKDCRKVARAKHPFIRRGAKKCAKPNSHTQPCYCMKLAAAKERDPEWVALQGDRQAKELLAHPKLESAEKQLREKLLAEGI
jgi:hypothetical protein